MRDFRDFDRRFDRQRRRFDVIWRATMILIVLAWIGVTCAAVWLLLHPEAVGGWFARMAHGLAGGARG